MSAASKQSGRASMEMVHELHGLVIRELLRRLKSEPSAELLSVARAILRDNGADRANDARDVAKLKKLHGLYCSALAAALEVDRPSAAVLNEARQWLMCNGITKDFDRFTTEAEALRTLQDVAVPFRTQ